MQHDDCPTVLRRVTFNEINPFEGPSIENGQPVSYPIKDFDQLMKWRANDPSDPGQLFSVATVPHNPKIVSEGSTKTLLCHDMKGGYLNDRFVQGSTYGDPYYTRYWNMVDIFVYFSHHFVTVPPVSWINPAHRNGVTVLGTFISEGDDGYHRCKKIFSLKKKWQQVADQLVEIARFYRFDGWFLNIENKIDEDEVSAVVDFIEYLTLKMHTVDRNALVVWYDSVTRDGALQWQNQLNESNKCFYDKCDGIFLNYGWKEAELQRTKSLARCGSSVFVGIDVFGRGCYGGGGFNSAMAMEVIRRCSLSAGIFAPGWIYEKFGIRDFDGNDKRFWKTLQPYCPSFPLDATSGLVSRFNPGCNGRWFFNNAQDTMPLLPSTYFAVDGAENSPGGKMIVTVPTDLLKVGSLIDIFKIQMVLRGACATLISPVDCDLCFVLQSDRGIIEPGSEVRKQILHSGEEIRITQFMVDGMVVVQGIAIKIGESDLGCNFPIEFLQLLPGLRGEGDFSRASSKIKCVDEFWAKSSSNEDSYTFLFSGTLVFNDLPSDVASSDINCQIYSAEKSTEVFLGSSYCSRFRFHEISVPNPMFDGPGCYILFTVTHLSRSGIKLGASKLKMIYAENI